ncbi:hypothetical protein K450DRAFT_218505 [Umbelopsis ramanniana AG]|uniref:Uncharacterized protein n=1 Tax=Umbelopsis ramanniana AG TaxID=1314678 RepID=A0AAD5EI79_UMBRA|nr:uncharacterized protein K450DRAFT_218505 [Umbelopsis ramanniana AG]KAI8584168.1 hypothetical protein K450DRAFT_218505 [Umbelopsis ramanniana AG]
MYFSIVYYIYTVIYIIYKTKLLINIPLNIISKRRVRIKPPIVTPIDLWKKVFFNVNYKGVRDVVEVYGG